jgi:hypothetical protein
MIYILTALLCLVSIIHILNLYKTKRILVLNKNTIRNLGLDLCSTKRTLYSVQKELDILKIQESEKQILKKE